MEDEKTSAPETPAPSQGQDILLSSLKPSPRTTGTPKRNRSNDANRCPVRTGRTPPVTPPGRRSASPCSPKFSRGDGSGDFGKVPSTGVAAPASAVDDVMEKFGRPRARSLSRHDRRMSLPAWEEESDDGLPEAVEPLKERRRTMSMSAAEGFCGRQPRRQMAGRVKVLMEGCDVGECQKTSLYGFNGEDRQRLFVHRETGMMQSLGAAIDEGHAAGPNDAATDVPLER